MVHADHTGALEASGQAATFGPRSPVSREAAVDTASPHGPSRRRAAQAPSRASDLQCSLAVPQCAIRLLAAAATTTDAAALPNGLGFTVVTVIPFEELRRSTMSALFEGRDDAPISFFVTEFPRGRGPDLHMHPYPEVLLVETGTALFTMGERQFTVSGEHVVVVPAHTPHAFKGAGDDTLRVVSVHSSGTVIQTDL